MVGCAGGAGEAEVRKDLPPLPKAYAPFEREGAVRQKVVLKATKMTYRGKGMDALNFCMGDKRVMVCGADGAVDCNHPIEFGRLVIYMGRKAYAAINLGPYRDRKAPNVDELTVDEKAGTVTWKRPYTVPGTTNETATFTYTVSGTADSRVRVDYDFGVAQEKADAIGNKFHGYTWCNLSYMGDVEKNTFGAGGKKWEAPGVGAFAELIKNGKDKWHLQTGGTFMPDGPFFHEPENEELRFEIKFPKGAVGRAPWYPTLARRGKDWKESRQGVFPIVGLSHFHSSRPGALPVKGRIEIDLFKSSLARHKAEPATGGIDFWASDALHVPARPTRNLLVNGSFEQGLKHWRWEDGGSFWSEPENGEPEKYSIVTNNAHAGRRAMWLTGGQRRLAGVCSAAMPLRAGVKHVASVWARTAPGKKTGYLAMTPRSVAMRGNRAFMKFKADPDNVKCQWGVKEEEGWKRFEYTFTPDDAGVYMGLSGNNVLVDSIQVEEGEKATEWTDDPVVAHLRTSDPDNDLRPGEAFDARLELTGRANLGYGLKVRVTNAYRETVWETEARGTLDANGLGEAALDMPAEKMGEGVFVLRYDFETADGKKWTDYERMAVMEPCNGTHATKNFYSSFPWFGRMARAGDFARKRFEWGYGSTDGQRNETLLELPEAKFYDMYGFKNIVHPVAYERACETNAALRAAVLEQNPELKGQKHFSTYRNIKKATPEVVKALEETAYALAKACHTNDTTWTWWNEDEDRARTLGYEEYFKLQHACWKGCKRAFDERGLKLGFTPTHGTSHYFRGRNYDAVDGYMETANRHGFKYTAISIHPYSNIDGGVLGGHDSDVETQHLISRMKHYGYPDDTPIYFTECFNMLSMNIPEWGARGWADGFRGQQMPSLAGGVRETTHAASLMRLYIIALKFWPKVQLVHPWLAPPVFDLGFSQWYWAKVANTLARMLPDPRWHGDAQPFGDVRGYCFRQRGKDGKEMAVMPVWTTNHDVELGRRQGPTILMDLPKGTRAYDMNGNERRLPAPDKGTYAVGLTQAPLFLVHEDAAALLKALEEAGSDDPTTAIAVDVRPGADGALELRLTNETKKRQAGETKVGDETVAYDIPPKGEFRKELLRGGTEPLKMNTWKGTVGLLTKPWETQWFYVERCGDKPDWGKIPAMPITNEVRGKDGKPVKMKAKFQAAYNADYFHLRVEVTDPQLVELAKYPQPVKKQQLYIYDTCLEVFFDGFADARTQGERGYDENDSRYDFAQGMCHRLRAVNWQLAQGTRSATDEEIRTKLRQKWERTEKGCVYEIAFAQRYMAPIDLKPGTVCSMGLYLHDYFEPGEKVERGLSLATRKGATCDQKPYLWPIMVFK